MASKQFDHLQALSLQRLRARIPSECPLVVTRDAQRGGFLACTLDMVDQAHGRFQVVHAFIDGYVAAWQRARPRVAVDAVSRTELPRGTPRESTRRGPTTRSLRSTGGKRAATCIRSPAVGTTAERCSSPRGTGGSVRCATTGSRGRTTSWPRLRPASEGDRMDQYFREAFEGLKQATEGLQQAGLGIIAAAEGMKKALDAALVARDEHEDLRVSVARLETELLDLSKRFNDWRTDHP